LAKLDGSPHESLCTIVAGDDSFSVTAEEDAVHYLHPSRQATNTVGFAGIMHPDTEARLLEGG